MKKAIFCLSLCLAFAGCSVVENVKNDIKIPKLFSRKAPKETSIRKEYLKPALFVEKGKVVNAERLSKGGKLLIKPFKAGPDVEANDELDKIALRLVQGLAEQLEGNRPYFELIDPENQDDADIVLEGYFTKKYEPGKFARWVLFKHKRKLAVEGKMIDLDTGETLLIFEDEQSAKDADKDFRYLGFIIGQNAGRFISSGAE